jgi:hypothetical protein
LRLVKVSSKSQICLGIASFCTMQRNGSHVTCVLIGDTGVGKSEFGNRYLLRDCFEASDSVCPVTLALKVESQKGMPMPVQSAQNKPRSLHSSSGSGIVVSTQSALP